MLVKNFDRLSDKLCGVIDLCESIYTSHPEQRWKNEAGRVYEELCRVMNEMNVDVELYEVSAYGSGPRDGEDEAATGRRKGWEC